MGTEFRLLGTIEARVDDRPVPLGYAQLRAVLAVLLVEVNRVVPVDQLVDRVWGTRTLPRRPRSAIQHHVTLLRRTLTAIPDTGIAWEAPGYRLTADPTTIDLHEFHRLSDQSRACADDAQAMALLTRALRQWGGEPFAGADTPWFDAARATLIREHHAARHDLNDLRLREGQHGALVPELFDLTQQEPLDERLAGQYVLALYRSGRQAEALAHYHRVQRLLAEELGTDPSPPLQQLHQRILTADPTLGAGSQPVPDPAAATAMFSMRADIPAFTGRDAELHILLDTAVDERGAAESGGVRAIAIHTVDGMPGVGKTAFSVHTAHRLADRFPDGNIFLDLRGHTPGQQPLTPGAALESLLRAAGVDPKQIPPTLEDRARLWRDRLAGKRVLLVLDDAADHDQIRPLLPGTAGNLVLITSRHRLAALDGVTPLTLDVLAADQALALLARLAGRAPDPGSDDHAGMARIADRCGYLPLAITLAGAQLRSHPTWSTTYLAELLAIEHERLEHLDVGDRSVRAAFDMSFRHRPATEQLLFRLLGVHPGPDIDAFATAALTNRSVRDARRGLAGLHADHVIEETAPGRYRLHDLLRAYARALATDLDPDDRRDALNRVLTYYQYTVQKANIHLPEFHTSPLPPITTAPAQAPGLDNPSTAHGWLAAELSTLIACVQHAAAGANTPAASHLATALHTFLRASGYTDYALDIHQIALTAARDSDDQVGQANALVHLGDIRQMRGEHAVAMDDMTRALDLFTATGNRLGQASALANLGRVQYQQSQHVAATDNLTRALDLYTEMGNQLGQANALICLGDMQYLTARWAAATDNLTRALDLFTAMGNRLGQANARTYLSFMQYQQGEYTAATDNLTSALDLYTAIGNRVGQANALANLGRLQYSQGECAAATDSLTRGLELFTAMGNRVGQINVLTNLGRVQCAQGEYAAATESLTRALDLSTALGNQLGQANARTNLGIVQRLQGEYGTATENLLRALDLFTAVEDADGEAETLNNLGDLALDHPESGDPSTYFSRALAIAKDIGTTKHEAHALSGQARCLLPTADRTQAIALFHQAHSLYRTLGVPEAIEIEVMLSTLDDRSAGQLMQ